MFTGNYSAQYGGAIASNNTINVYQWPRSLHWVSCGRMAPLTRTRRTRLPTIARTAGGGAISTGADGRGDNTNGIYTTVRIYGSTFAE